MLDNDSFTAETMHRDLVECMPEALILADREGIVRIWNPGAERLFGYSAAEAVGQYLDLIIPEQLRKAHWTGFHRAIDLGATAYGGRSIITRSLHKSGQTLYVDMSFAVVRDRDGKAVGAMAVARDATLRYTEEKKLRKQLAEMTAKQVQ